MKIDSSTQWDKCLQIVNADLRIDASKVQTTSSSECYRVSSGEPTDEERLRLLEASGSLDFWNHPDEDIYSKDDGDPL